MDSKLEDNANGQRTAGRTAGALRTLRAFSRAELWRNYPGLNLGVSIKSKRARCGLSGFFDHRDRGFALLPDLVVGLFKHANRRLGLHVRPAVIVCQGRQRRGGR
jgi:hypothetical protein